MPHWDSFDAFLAQATQTSLDERQKLVDELLATRPVWPWAEHDAATFILNRPGVSRAALNLDTIKADPPFAPMRNLEGTTLWYVRREFAPDDLLDYMLAIDDPMTPLAKETDIVGRVSRHWQVDPLNPIRMQTAQLNVSVLRMPEARPCPDWQAMSAVARGHIVEHVLDSRQLGFTGRRVWVYTPPGYAQAVNVEYPLLVLHDGQWCNGPLQAPFIADALIKHNRMEPVVIAMLQSGTEDERRREFISNDRHYLFLLMELLPLIQTHYRIDALRLGVGGMAVGAAAAAHAALSNPTAFTRLIMISPPLGKGPNEAQLRALSERFAQADVLPQRIFQSVGRYEAPARFLKPGHELRQTFENRRGLEYRFVETGSGHGLVGFKGILPEALAWAFPGPSST